MTQHGNNQEAQNEIPEETLQLHASHVATLAGKLRDETPNPTPLSSDASTIAAAIIYGNLLRKPKD